MAVTSQTSRTFFSGTNIATTNYTYNAAGSTGADAGWVPDGSNESVVQVCVATLNAATFMYRIEGRFNSTSRAGEVTNASIYTAQTIDDLIRISERVNEIRVGAKVLTDASASPNNFYAAILRTELR